MHVLTFRAPSMQEALQLVRENLGPDASVVSTRQVRRGLFAGSMIEVQASRELMVPSRFQDLTTPSGQPSQIEEATPETMHDPRLTPIVNESFPQQVQQNFLLNAENSIGSERSSGFTQSNRSFLQPESTHQEAAFLHTAATDQLYSELIQEGVPSQLATDLLSEACRQCNIAFHDDIWLIRGQIVEVVARRLSIATTVEYDASEQRILAFVGPPDAGKTTMLCRIAARAYDESQLEIGIVALDSWRSDGADQLLVLADSISAQVEAVSTADQLALALQRLRECDLVLIDTAGHSAGNESQMGHLQELLQIAQPDEVHLVLEAKSVSSHGELAINRFSRLGANRLHITKLDESRDIGLWLTSLFSCQIPVQCLSHAAEYTTGMIQPSARYLASVLLGQKKLNTNNAPVVN